MKGTPSEPIDVQPERLKNLLRDLVDTYSPSGKEEDVVKYAEEYLRNQGLTVTKQEVDENRYNDPFHILPRPRSFPWHFDTVLGMRCYGGPHAKSSLRVLNTWYGTLARWLFPIYDWAQDILAGKEMPSRLGATLKRLYG